MGETIWDWSADGAPDAIFDQALAEHKQKQQASAALLGYETWNLDMVAGQLILRFADGRVLTAPAQAVGSFSTEDENWQWAWDNPSINRLVAQDVLLCRQFGERYKLPQYTRPLIDCALEDAYGFAAVALHFAGATGVFHQPSGVIRVSMILGPVTVQAAN